MEFLQNISLKPFNTFGLDVSARYFCRVSTLEELFAALNHAQELQTEVLVLGGGSNVLFTKDFNGLILKNELKGIEKIGEDEDFVYLKAGAGEVWHEFVLHCLAQNLAGVENLALIPGSVGASPMQNIGAYGVEIKEVIHELTAVHRNEGYQQVFNKSECLFGYRESVFKNKYKDQFVITSVTYRLRKKPELKIEYGAIRLELEKQLVEQPTIQAVARAVMAIRNAKLPNPAEIGNAGSFFKNPSIDNRHFLQLQNEFSSIVGYSNADGTVKLAAGWLIEQCGFRGFRNGDAGVHQKQALVLVNYGSAVGSELLQLSIDIRKAVQDKFGVTLTTEVNII